MADIDGACRRYGGGWGQEGVGASLGFFVQTLSPRTQEGDGPRGSPGNLCPLLGLGCQFFTIILENCGDPTLGPTGWSLTKLNRKNNNFAIPAHLLRFPKANNEFGLSQFNLKNSVKKFSENRSTSGENCFRASLDNQPSI